MSERLPIIIQTVIYKVENNQVLFLLLKRSEEKGGFWNAVNGTMEAGESVAQCREREICEETGINKLLNCSEELYKFNFDYKDKTMTTRVYTAQVGDKQEIRLNNEHSEYGWFNFNQALEKLKFLDDKRALEICYNVYIGKPHAS